MVDVDWELLNARCVPELAPSIRIASRPTSKCRKSRRLRMPKFFYAAGARRCVVVVGSRRSCAGGTVGIAECRKTRDFRAFTPAQRDSQNCDGPRNAASRGLAELPAVEFVVLQQAIESAAGEAGFQGRGLYVAVMAREQVAEILPLELREVGVT